MGRFRPWADGRKQLPDGRSTELLFDPLHGPAIGMVSVISPYSLAPGEFQHFSNIRRDRRALRVRDGHERYDTGGLPNDGQYRGSLSSQLVGVYFFNLSAYQRSSTNRIHLYATQTGTYGEITASSGQYGDTRFPAGSGPIFMASVTDRRSSVEHVVFQDNASAPRVWRPGGAVAIHEPITVPPAASNLKTRLTFPAFFPVSGATRPTYANADSAKQEAKDTGTSPNQSIELKIKSGWTAGATSTVTFANPIDLTVLFARQLTFLIETGVLSVADSLKIELSNDGVNFFAAWDPNDLKAKRTRAIEFDVQGTKEVMAFEIDSIVPSLGAVKHVRFTWVGAAPGSELSIKIHMIAFGGQVRGRARHGTSYWNSGSMAESYGIAILDVQPDRVKDLGGPDMNGARIPNDYELMYDYAVEYANTSVSERNKGVDTLCVYRRDFGETRFVSVASVPLATWNPPNWAFSIGTELSTETFVDRRRNEDKDFELEMPSGEHVTMPIGSAMLAANNRFFVGARSSTGFSPGVWFSTKDYPFRFRPVAPTSDPNSGSSVLLPGQNVMAFASVATSSIAANTIYVFTERAVYEMSGLSSQNLQRWTKISPTGTKSPFAVAERDGDVYYLDDRLQLRRIRAGLDNLSRLTVDDKLQGIPPLRRAWVAMAFFGERLYLSYTPAGDSANTRCLVFHELMDQFEADDEIPLPMSVEGMNVFYDNDGTQKRARLLCYSSDRTVFEYERPGAQLDGGSKINVKVISREIHYPDDQVFTVERVGVHVDADEGSTLTITKRYPRRGVANPGTVNLTSADSRVFAWERPGAPSGGDGRPNGPSCVLEVAGMVRGGKSIYSIVYDVSLDSGFDRDGQ